MWFDAQNIRSGKYHHSEYLFLMNNDTTANIPSCERFHAKNFVLTKATTMTEMFRPEIRRQHFSFFPHSLY
jgi:hypothetical protein